MSSEPLEKTRIFVVDDEQTIASTLAVILNQVGFHATAFTQPHQALEAAQVAQPHLLLSDVVMPGLSGLDLAVQILAVLPSCKVLLLSGHTDTAHLLDLSMAQGHAFQVLAKPVHPKALISEIRSVLA